MHAKPFIVTVFVSLVVFGSCGGNRGDDFATDQSLLHYYSETYEEASAAFLKAAESARVYVNNAEIKRYPLPSLSDHSLYIDTAYFAPKKNQRHLVIMTTAVHGIEGYAGNAVLRMILKELFPVIDHDTTGYLFIHGVNPWGMKHFRRFTENNVDFNRNSDFEKTIFTTENRGYARLKDFLAPAGKADHSACGKILFTLKSFWMVIRNGMATLREAILRGQYQYPKGLYYGGADFEPQKKILEDIIVNYARGYSRVMPIDIHTAYGNRGQLHLFAIVTDDKKQKEYMETAFSGFTIDWPVHEDFYVVSGDFNTYEAKFLKSKLHVPVVVPMSFEFGTINNIGVMGSIDSLYRVILENQGAQHGYADPEAEREIKELNRELYYPASTAWRSEILRQAKKVFSHAMNNFGSL